MRPISASTKPFFFMFPRHRRSGNAGRSRLGPDELVGRLRAVAHRQLGVHVELAGFADAGDQLFDRDRAERFARALRFLDVALNEAAVGSADTRDRLAGSEVQNLVDVHARVRLAPAEDGKLHHGES